MTRGNPVTHFTKHLRNAKCRHLFWNFQMISAMKNGINISRYTDLEDNYGYTGDKIERSGGGV